MKEQFATLDISRPLYQVCRILIFGLIHIYFIVFSKKNFFSIFSSDSMWRDMYSRQVPHQSRDLFRRELGGFDDMYERHS